MERGWEDRKRLRLSIQQPVRSNNGGRDTESAVQHVVQPIHNAENFSNDVEMVVPNQSEPDEEIPLSSQNPEQIFFRIPLIREKVLTYLSNKDMTDFRLASSVWNDILSAHMLKGLTPVVTFEFNSDDRNHHSPTKFGHKTMTDFLDCVSKSKIFPCNNFSIIGGGDFSNPREKFVIQFKQFFTKLGPQIKRLQFGSSNGPFFKIGIRTFRSIMLKVAPNIEILELDYIPDLLWSSTNRLSLPALKSITCLDSYRSTAFDMLKEAPKLETVNNFKIYCINSFIPKFKIELIKRLSFIICPGETIIKHLLTFAKAGPSLTSFFLPHILPGELNAENQRDFVKAINLILESSKDSLQDLEVSSMAVEGLRFPLLKNVKKLKLWFRNSDRSFFGSGINMSETFPNVTLLNWSCATDRIVNWETVIPRDTLHGTLSKVKTCTVSSPELRGCLGKIFSLTPNVTTFNIITDSSTLTELWRLDERGSLLADSVITGIPERTCRMLKQTTKKKELSQLKTQSGITDLKSLRCLNIILDNHNWGGNSISLIALPSWISGVYGFALLPSLKVTIAYNQHCLSAAGLKTALESIQPYANIVHDG